MRCYLLLRPRVCTVSNMVCSWYAAVGGATSGAVIGALDIPAGFGNNTSAAVVEVPSAIEQVMLDVICSSHSLQFCPSHCG